MAKYNLNDRFWQKHDITVRACGHFALSPLSETCLKDAIFDISVTSKVHKKKQNSKMSILTSKSTIVSYLDSILSKLTHFDLFLYVFDTLLIQFQTIIFLIAAPFFIF